MVFSSERKRRRKTVRLPLVALTAAASVAMAVVVVHDGSVHGDLRNSPAAPVVYAGDEDDSEMLRQLRDISRSRRLEQDDSTGRPGIFLG